MRKAKDRECGYIKLLMAQKKFHYRLNYEKLSPIRRRLTNQLNI